MRMDCLTDFLAEQTNYLSYRLSWFALRYLHLLGWIHRPVRR